MAKRVLKKNSLRTKLETPDVYDRDEEGNVIYPQGSDGTGGAFTYNEAHMGDAPPAQEVEVPDDDDLDDVATAAMLALAAKRNKENLKQAADTHHKNLDAAADVQRGRLERAAKAEHKNLSDAAKRTHDQMRDAGAAQARLGAAALDAQTTGQGPIMVPQGIVDSEPGRAPNWEDFTNIPLAGQENAGGYVPDSPTGNDYAVSSGPLPSGVEEGAHGSPEASPQAGEHTHEGLMLSARHARQQARGAANQSLQAREKALGKIGERKAKGLPTENLEREAGWAYSQEQRARGMEQEASRIEVGQRYREMEDIGAEKAQVQRRAGADYNESLKRDAEQTQDAQSETRKRKEENDANNDAVTAGVAVATADQVLMPDQAPDLSQSFESSAFEGPAAPDQPTTTATVQEGAPPELDPATRRAVSAGAQIPERSNAQPSTPAQPSEDMVAPVVEDGTRGPEGVAYGQHPVLPVAAESLVNRATFNEWDTAYQLNIDAEENYNRAEDEQAARQNQIQDDDDDADDPMRSELEQIEKGTELNAAPSPTAEPVTAKDVDDSDPMMSEESQQDANAPFRDSPPLSPADEDQQAKVEEQEDIEKKRELELQAAMIQASNAKKDQDIPDAPDAPAPK